MTIFVTDMDMLVDRLDTLDYTIIDTEFTSWDGSLKRNWSQPSEYREIVNIGLLRITVTRNQIIVGRAMELYFSPLFAPTLSNYFVELTGITQASLEGKPSFNSCWQLIVDFIGNSTPLSNGNDGQIIRENLFLHKMCSPPFYTCNIRSILMNHLCLSDYQCISSDLPLYIPHDFHFLPGIASGRHTGLFDCYSLLSALSYIHASKGLLGSPLGD